MKTLKREKRAIALAFATTAMFASPAALAIPQLQIYIEGSSYVGGSEETWILSGSNSFKLWVIGNVSGSGGKGTIYDVKLTAAVATSESGSIAITPTTTGLLTDPSAPSAPVPVLFGSDTRSSDGAVPVTGDGSLLPTHDVYGTGASFYEWNLGDLDKKDSPIADFSGPMYPTSFAANTGEINAYLVSVSGYSSVHFDAFDHVVAKGHSKYVFAPFSHDGEIASPVPEPETYAMLLAGLGLLGLAARRRKLKAAA